MKKFCEECNKEVATKVITKKESYSVCGEPIEVEAEVLVCAECGEEFFCEELDEKTLTKAYNAYRKKHNLLFPEEIRRIREMYGLSQRSFAKILHWGDKTFYRYENGAIQDKAHNNMLVFLHDPKNMQAYLSGKETLLEERQKVRLEERLEVLLKGSDQTRERNIIDLYFKNNPSIENGFKEFDYEKLCAMVRFFAKKGPELLKVKLLKLLNYADMMFYKENGVSISGMRYIHLPYGPVPANYDLLFGVMEADQVAHIEVLFENGYEKHRVVSDSDNSQNVLSEKELEVLERIYDKFADFGSAEISNYSHQEKCYQATKTGEIISYAYAKEMEL